jgi:hypothetical protein
VQLALNVDDIDAAGAGAGAVYSELFSAVPAKRRPGYANFAIDDPALKLRVRLPWRDVRQPSGSPRWRSEPGGPAGVPC